MLVYVLIILLGIGLILGDVAYKLVLVRFTKRRNKNFSDVYPYKTIAIPTSDEKKWFNNHSKDVYKYSYDNLKLHSYQLDNDSHNWALLIHGYKGGARENAHAAKVFYEKGYNVLAPNLKGHGKSEGMFMGMGYLDSKDLVMWINYIVSIDKSARIVIFGESMGAFAAMVLIGELLSNNVVCAIEDSGYTNVWDEFKHELNHLHIPWFPLLNVANILCKIKLHYSFKEASAIPSLIKTNIPCLFIQGDKDNFVPFKMLNELYEAKKDKKDKLVIKNARHIESEPLAGPIYWDKVFDFIGKYL